MLVEQTATTFQGMASSVLAFIHKEERRLREWLLASTETVPRPDLGKRCVPWPEPGGATVHWL
jgi:hypothetical protein